MNTTVEVRRNGRLAAVVAAASGLLAAAYFVRAASGGAALDWVLFGGLALLSLAYLRAVLDARTPLLVADDHGVRLRLGGAWRGLLWAELEEVEHQPRKRLLRDGRLVLFPHEDPVEGLGRWGRLHARLNTRLYGAPLAVPLGLATHVKGDDGDLTETLVGLAEGRSEIVEIVPAREEKEPAGEDAAPEEAAGGSAEDTAERPLVPSPTPSPLREPVAAVRAEVVRERAPEPEDTQPVPRISAAAHDTMVRADGAAAWRSSTVLIGEVADLPAVDPVVGPEIAGARMRLGLSVDQLAERTRIRPHVIEAIEVDDFGPCGGDFYARGHLRTLARILGLDPAPLLATYDERYADAPVDPRRVFEAELASGAHAPLRATRGGPSWSVLVAAVMAVVLAWSVARLLMDNTGPVAAPAPSFANSSGGLNNGAELPPPVPVTITAAGGGAHVVVRDGGNAVVFKGSLAFGQTHRMRLSAPVRVQSTDGSLKVEVDGHDCGNLGRTGEPAQDVLTAEC